MGTIGVVTIFSALAALPGTTIIARHPGAEAMGARAGSPALSGRGQDFTLVRTRWAKLAADEVPDANHRRGRAGATRGRATPTTSGPRILRDRSLQEGSAFEPKRLSRRRFPLGAPFGVARSVKPDRATSFAASCHCCPTTKGERRHQRPRLAIENHDRQAQPIRPQITPAPAPQGGARRAERMIAATNVVRASDAECQAATGS
jgi:hypothetical protein